jgi:hypothetical protein
MHCSHYKSGCIHQESAKYQDMLIKSEFREAKTSKPIDKEKSLLLAENASRER